MFHPQMAKKLLPLVVIAALGYGAYYYVNLPPTSLVLTGIVTDRPVPADVREHRVRGHSTASGRTPAACRGSSRRAR